MRIASPDHVLQHKIIFESRYLEFHHCISKCSLFCYLFIHRLFIIHLNYLNMLKPWVFIKCNNQVSDGILVGLNPTLTTGGQ